MDHVISTTPYNTAAASAPIHRLQTKLNEALFHLCEYGEDSNCSRGGEHQAELDDPYQLILGDHRIGALA